MAGEYDGEAEVTGLGSMSDFEQALRTLALPASRMDRDRLMFLAGRASAEAAVTSNGRVPRLGWAWPAATAVSVCCSVVLGALLVVRGGAAGPGPELVGPAPSDGDRSVVAIDHAVPEPPTGDAVVRHDHGEPAPPVPPAPPTRAARGPAFGSSAFGTHSADASRLPPYLRMRQLVFEKGLDALSPATPSGRERDPIADARLIPARTLRAVDRPGGPDAALDELLDGTLLTPEGSL